jgi:hypothetical protein
VNSTKVITPAQAVHWAVDQHCTLVVNENRREVFRLTGLEQAFWDCLTLGYSYQQSRDVIAALGKLDLDAADREIQSILAEWHRLHLVEIEEVGHG